MKRAFSGAAVLAVSLALPACPVDSHDGCRTSSECAPGLFCQRSTGLCIDPTQTAGECETPRDCGVNETCSEAGACEIGDCTFWGCVTGFQCAAEDGVWLCVRDEGAGGAAGTGGAAGATGGAAGAAAGAAGQPAEAGAGAGGEGGSPTQ